MALANGDRADGAAREAFGAFFERHAGWLQALVKARQLGRIVDWDEGVKDVVQITFKRAFRGASGFELDRLAGCDSERARRRVRAWLGGIANRVVVDLLRAQAPLLELDEERDADPETPLDVLLGPDEEGPLIQALKAELEKLPPREREILAVDVQHKLGAGGQHLPAGVARALAEKWNTTPENIRQIRRRTLQKLKEALAHLFN